MRLLKILLVVVVIGCDTVNPNPDYKPPRIDLKNGHLDMETKDAIISLLNYIAKRENASEISLDTRSLASDEFKDDLIFHEDMLKRSYEIDARKILAFFRDADLNRGFEELPAWVVIENELSVGARGVAISLPVFVGENSCVFVVVEHLQKSEGMRLYFLKKTNYWEVSSHEVLSIF